MSHEPTRHVMRFSGELRQSAEPIWGEMFAHPLLRQFCDGSLPVETFRYFLIQDWHYLDAFARCVGIAIDKARDAAMLERLAGRLVKPVEKSLHRKLFALLGVEPSVADAVPVSPTCLGYMNHMLVTAMQGSLGETAAVLLPCPWTPQFG